MPDSLRTTESENPIAIRVAGLHKSYRIWESPFKRLGIWLVEVGVSFLVDVLGSDNPLTRHFAALTRHGYREIHALRDISLTIGRGEVVGIIGYNGSGKSTLLQILAGTLTPTEGQVEVNGRVAALLELGSGINPDFTGRENIYLYGAILGLPQEFLDSRIHAIEEFAEIGEAIDEAVKTYSTGMVARLAFSVLTQLDPDILIVDETLSVGDAYFQHKSIGLIRRFQEAGKTMLVVSHDLGTIKSMCTSAVILERGTLVREGDAGPVCDYYNALVAKKQKDLEIRQYERIEGHVVTRSGNRRLTIGDVELLNATQTPSRAFTVGETVHLACAIEVRGEVVNPTVGILIRDRLGNDVFGTNTHHQKVLIGTLGEGSICEVIFTFAMNLGPGRYSITAAVHSGRDHLTDNYDWQDNAVVFVILPGTEKSFIGIASLPLQIEVNTEGVELHRPYVWGEELSFGSDGNSIRHKQRGWAVPEELFTWTDGHEAVLRLDLPPSTQDRTLRVKAAGYCNHLVNNQRANIYFDDDLIGSLEIRESAEYSVRITADRLASRKRHSIRFALPDAISPAAQGFSSDSRLLGIRVYSARIE